jgi:hypothetical protein
LREHLRQKTGFHVTPNRLCHHGAYGTLRGDSSVKRFVAIRARVRNRYGNQLDEGFAACAHPVDTKGDDTVKDSITLVLANFPLTFLIIGLIVSLAAIGRLPKPAAPALVVDVLLAWFVFFNVGASNTCNFILHAFFGATTAQYIGWPDSPFQFEVAAASLGFAAVGFVAAFRSLEVRLCAILGSSVFMLGGAYGHVREMMTANNSAPGNTGLIFYADILIPVIGFALLWMQHRLGQPWTRDRRKSPWVR